MNRIKNKPEIYFPGDYLKSQDYNLSVLYSLILLTNSIMVFVTFHIWLFLLILTHFIINGDKLSIRRNKMRQN